ncbi:MAG: primosomal replication protein N [Alcanivorax sp.]|nr:primosomal replication protein N [Alcanivorax sp.]
MTGAIHTLERPRLTPAGVPTRKLWLEHRSRQQEDGAAREVQARIGVVLTGEALIALSNQLQEGDRIRVRGFLARAGFKGEARDRLHLHAEQLECL